MTRTVILGEDNSTVTLENVTKDNGYVMFGCKGAYILGKDTNGKFIWVKATPGSVTKPVHTYETIKEAIKDKLERGYEVLEYSNVDFN